MIPSDNPYHSDHPNHSDQPNQSTILTDQMINQEDKCRNRIDLFVLFEGVGIGKIGRGKILGISIKSFGYETQVGPTKSFFL